MTELADACSTPFRESGAASALAERYSIASPDGVTRIAERAVPIVVDALRRRSVDPDAADELAGLVASVDPRGLRDAEATFAVGGHEATGSRLLRHLMAERRTRRQLAREANDVDVHQAAGPGLLAAVAWVSAAEVRRRLDRLEPEPPGFPTTNGHAPDPPDPPGPPDRRAVDLRSLRVVLDAEDDREAEPEGDDQPADPDAPDPDGSLGGTDPSGQAMIDLRTTADPTANDAASTRSDRRNGAAGSDRLGPAPIPDIEGATIRGAPRPADPSALAPDPSMAIRGPDRNRRRDRPAMADADQEPAVRSSALVIGLAVVLVLLVVAAIAVWLLDRGGQVDVDDLSVAAVVAMTIR
ncbi:MAG: DUF937 domain-containing protein [Actinomycetota bacterium]